MKISIACDKAGLQLKDYIINNLSSEYEFIDFIYDENDSIDYPDYAKKVANSIINKQSEFGILICGTGIGMSISANRFKGIRAGLCHNSLEAKLTREHNDANVICLGARIIGQETALDNVKIFLATKFSGVDRHIRRINKIDE